MALFTSAQLTQMASGKFHIVDLLEISFHTSDTFFFDTYRFSTLNYDKQFTKNFYSRTYTGGFTAKLTGTDTAADFSRKNISFEFSGLSSTLLQKVQSNRHVNAPFTLYKAILDEDNQQVGDYIEVYNGIINSGGYTLSPNNSVISLNGSHTLYNFEITNNVMTNIDSYTIWRLKNNKPGGDWLYDLLYFRDVDKNEQIYWGTN